MGDWTPDEIIAEANRLLTKGGNPHNVHADLMTALGMIAGLAELIKPQHENNNPKPKDYGE